MSAMLLYDCAFSPFARKVRMVLEYKALAFTAIDGLHAANRAALAVLNPRREVPTLVDGDLVVVNSSHIVAYLDEAYPDMPVLPRDPIGRARAREWERIADTVLDPIVVDLSLWSWAKRDDTPPAGLFEAARRDLEVLYRQLEYALQANGAFLCGDFSIADIALFPNLHATRALGVGASPPLFPRLTDWLARIRGLTLVRADLERARAWIATAATDAAYEKTTIVWRGERIEWLLSAGFHRWFFNEIECGRVHLPKHAAAMPPA